MSILADVEHLLDHAAEHRAYLHNAVFEAVWHSPAWTVVTTYYWAFFSCLALTRLIGNSVWFLGRPALADLRQLAGSQENPGAGALHFTVDPYSTATLRTLSLTPGKGPLHQGLWSTSYRVISDICAHSDQHLGVEEYRCWSSLKSAGDLLGADWPSKLRNAVNYRPGEAYREVIQDAVIDIKKHIRQQTPSKFRDLVANFEGQTMAIRARPGLKEDTPALCRLLGTYSLLLAGIVDTLHSEVLDRQNGDKRWATLRSRFLKKRCVRPPGANWPFSD